MFAYTSMKYSMLQHLSPSLCPTSIFLLRIRYCSQFQQNKYESSLNEAPFKKLILKSQKHLQLEKKLRSYAILFLNLRNFFYTTHNLNATYKYLYYMYRTCTDKHLHY